MALDANAQFRVSEETKMTITGTSTIHDWTSDVTQVDGSMVIEEKALKRGTLKKGDRIERVEIIVPVKSIVSPRGATMDKKTYNALKSEEHPNIRFLLIDNKVTGIDGDTILISAKGDLTIAGYTNTISMEVKGVPKDDGAFLFKGGKELNMVDYEIEPPSAMFGQIVTGEEVTINFEVVFTNP